MRTVLGARWYVKIIMASTVTFAVAGIVLLKSVAVNAIGGTARDYAALSVSWAHVMSVVLLIIAALSYTLLLRFVSLYVAQRVAAVQFGAIVLAGTVFLGEQLSLLAWAGIVLIGLGIALMGRESREPTSGR